MSEENGEITELLRGQHKAFGSLLAEMGEALKASGRAGADGIQGPLGRLIPALIVHERIEHELLFPAVLAHVREMEPGILDLFKETHKEIHDRLEALQEALGDRGASLGRTVTAVDFISLLREHFEQEERTLFPLFEKQAPGDVRRELGLRAGEYVRAQSNRRKMGGKV